MEGTYSLYFGDRPVGTAEVSREGLYYRFDCQCRLEKREVCKICVACGEDRIVLGTPFPEGQIFKLRTRLPVKRFCGGNLHFSISGSGEGMFIPVKQNEPFLHLKDLKNAVMQVRDGVSGIFIQK